MSLPYKPLLDEAINLARHKPQACMIFQRPQCEAALTRGPRSRLAEGLGECGQLRQDQRMRRRSPPPIRSTFSTRQAPREFRRAWCATMAATWSRSSGRCRISTTSRPAKSGGPARTSAGSSAIPTLSMRRCFTAARRFFMKGKPVGTPDAGAFWRLIAQHGVVALFTAPTAFRAIKKEDPKGAFIGKYDLSKFRTLFLAGERADPPTIQWAEEVLNVPVIDHWWQTETGWCIAGNPVGLGALPVRYGSACVPMPGYAIDIVDEASKVQPANKIGSIVVKLPLPPACFPDAVAAGRAFQGKLSRGISRLLQDGGRRLQGRGRLRLRDEPHRRHHQCRRPQALDRRHGRSARRPSRRRRMRRARHQG